MSILGKCSVLSVVIHVLNIVASTAGGCYSMYLFYLLLFKEKSFSFKYLQSYIALIYIIILSIFITAVELHTLRHRHLIVLAYFLFFPTGKGFTFIFMGAILLGALVWGWVVGGVLLAVGVVNIILGFTVRSERQETVELQ